MLPLSAAAALLALALPSSKPSPPNVVIVYADDLGFADLGVVGDSGHHSASPTIDALAASGVILNSSYVYVWCAPSRAALMTGRYSMHTGYMCGGEPGSGCAVPLGFPFLPQHLKQANVSSACVSQQSGPCQRLGPAPR
jgi:arylsulfatase A-like enzyme